MSVGLLLLLSVLTVGGSVPASAGEENPFEYFGGLDLDPAVPSPESVLGYSIGERFTRHADLLDYVEEVASASNRVLLADYGRTHQRRRLVHLTVSAPENLARLQDILERNRELSDPAASDSGRVAETLEKNPAVVWFSYNVHGNEPSGSETSMQVLYTLAASRNPRVQEILSKVVLVIDPCLNPDGRERYVGFFDNVHGRSTVVHPDAAEHDEPWPGGRTNQYHFDLNRDWLWLTQPESRARIDVYRRHLPQLHIDYHEQGYRSPYFFGEGEEPYNKNIPTETREWIALYGRANAEVFDRFGLVYSTRERFDYLYPGYGKVLPIYHGAVGLLCEKGGHGRAGLGIEVSDQYTLTLTARARHHFLTSMSYLETTADHRRAQLERFRRFFVDSASAAGPGPKLFVVSGSNDPALLAKLWELAGAHGIRIEALTRDLTVEGMHSYRTTKRVDSLVLRKGDWVVRTAQRMGRLARALFEVDPTVAEPETYDITSWSLPVTFGLEAYYGSRQLDADALERVETYEPPAARVTGEGDVALLVDARQHAFPRAVGLASRHEVFARVAGGSFTVDGRTYSPGTLIVHTIRNPDRDLGAFIADLLAAGVSVTRVDSGLTSAGHVLGANDNRILELPRILLARGAPLSSYSYGQTWHLLDREAAIDHVPINLDRLSRIDLAGFNVLVLPDGGDLSGALGSSGLERLKGWVRNGGVVVASGGSASWAARTLVGLTPGQGEGDKGPKLSDLTYRQRQDRRVDERVSGALLRAVVDTSHPVAAGVTSWVGVLKRGGRVLSVRDNDSVIARFDEKPRLGGIVSRKNQEKIAGTPYVTHHRVGSGGVIGVAEDATFRGFHHNAMRLLLNAIVLGPTF